MSEPTTTTPHPSAGGDASAPEGPPDDVRVRPWPDPVIDTLGHDPRSLYAERFWLPTLGPTSFLLLRHINHRFEEEGLSATPDPGDVVELPFAATSQALGLGPRRGNNSPLRRSMDRLVQFDLAHPHRDGSLAVRLTVPPVNRRHARHLPERLRRDHERWLVECDGPRERAERRAHRIALVLAELGSDVDEAERVLTGMGFPPAVCRRAAQWGQSRHRQLDRHGEERRAASDTEPASDAPASDAPASDSPASDAAA